MQLAAGDGGQPRDRVKRLRYCGAVDGGVDRIDTAQHYGPGVVNELIREALFPHPEGLALVSKVGGCRDADQHHAESDAGGALGFLDGLGDGAAENQVEAEASGVSVHVAFQG
jgi:aryl-alcohol dehydrogenase-like predicted oxidoreductase